MCLLSSTSPPLLSIVLLLALGSEHCREEESKLLLDKLSLSSLSLIVKLAASLINCRRTSLVVRSCNCIQIVQRGGIKITSKSNKIQFEIASSSLSTKSHYNKQATPREFGTEAEWTVTIWTQHWCTLRQMAK